MDSLMNASEIKTPQDEQLKRERFLDQMATMLKGGKFNRDQVWYGAVSWRLREIRDILNGMDLRDPHHPEQK